MKLVGLLVALAGCDQVWGLDHHTTISHAQCPAEYVEIPSSTHRFLWNASTVTWKQAEIECESHSMGITHLAVFDNLPELVATRALVMAPTPWTAWVGYGRDRQSTLDDFFSVTGEPFSRASDLWKEGEPNAGFGLFDELGTVVTDSDYMNDQIATATTFSALCECDLLPADHTFVQE